MKKFIVMTLVLYIMGFLSFAYKINSYVQDKTTKTDAIVVLTGGKNRIKEGLKLIDTAMASKVFISGVGKKTNAKDLNVGNNQYVELGYKAKTTFENSLEVKEWIDDNGVKSIRLVTSNYHMPRAYLEIQDKNEGVKIIENPIYSDNIADKWWQHFGTFYFIFVEYNKFLYVFVRNLL